MKDNLEWKTLYLSLTICNAVEYIFSSISFNITLEVSSLGAIK